MSRLLRIGAVAAVLSAGLVLGASDPASATVTATTAGTVVTVTATGNESVRLDCNAFSQTIVNNAQPTPAIACSALTKVIVNGDSGGQTVFASQLDDPRFTANPFLQASLGDGSDAVYDSLRADSIDLGAGDFDYLIIKPGSVTNTLNNFGAGNNGALTFSGTPAGETITVTSTGATATVQIAGSPTLTQTGIGVANLGVNGGAGNDTINANGVTLASMITYLMLDGESGANTLSSTVHGAFFYDQGGSAVMTGGPKGDSFWTSSSSDVVHGGSGELNLIYDYESLRSGGRTIDSTAPAQVYSYLYGNDATARVRPGAVAGTARVTASLNRPGIQEMPANVSVVAPLFGSVGALPTRNLSDVVSISKDVSTAGDFSDDDIADVTITSGGYTTVGSLPGALTIQTADPNIGNVTLSHFGSYHLHGPWTNQNEGFAHRTTRDLLFRFLNTAQRQAIRDQLAAGTKTRTQIVDGIVHTDEYRGLDVDRVFRRFLRRQADAGGRTYWINRLREGRSLRKFRAQLFGSSEYFTKAGSTTSGFVYRAYADVLGRAPDTAGANYWINKIDTGTDRGSVANAFLVSSEARRFLVRDQFLRFLDRFPTDAELDTWMPVIESDAQGEQALIISLASSSAYYTRT